MQKVLNILAKREVRKYIYAVSIPTIALLVGLGVLADETAQLILSVVSAVLGVGTSVLAGANLTPDSENTHVLREEDAHHAGE